MTDPDQCIICLEGLQPPPKIKSENDDDLPSTPTKPGKAAILIDSELEILSDPDENHLIATLVGCNHVVHDRCIRSWAENSNTCPICRTTFNEVSLSTELGGPQVDSYAVQDKKQIHEFNLQQWLQENPDEADESGSPCPICGSAERPDILLLCDACDAAYHTHCVGLNHVPAGSWYCIECADFFTPSSNNTSDSDVQEIPPPPVNHRRPFPRTRARQRRARRQARSAEWQGAWGQIAGRIFDATNIDLDNHEDDDDALESFRRSQQQQEREAREYQEWEQRLQIASRQGARDAFARNIPREIGERLDIVPVVQETAEERRAWNALDRARESETGPMPNRRKRKSRSTTASPREPVTEEPERKLKRPRTRRLPVQGEASASGPPPPVVAGAGAGVPAGAAIASTTTPTPAAPTPAPAGTTSTAPPAGAPSPPPSAATLALPPQSVRSPEGTSFLTSLLKEVEMSTPSDDENVRNYFNSKGAADPSSPVASPSPSSHNSPRALSLTPPPFPRPSSPSTLSSYVEPVFPKANYSPTRTSGENSDSESRTRNGSSEIRQPRPRRPGRALPHSPTQSRSQNASPTRSEMSLEDKQRISGIVRAALRPHWQAQELTADQYANINRDVSRKLYEGLRDPLALDDDAKKAWEQIATKEVARAVSELKI